MTAHPILFNTAMVRAILAGHKTQTRRPFLRDGERCPFGAPGDTLWVRETWACLTGRVALGAPIAYRADTGDGERVRVDAPWRPSIHMPRWASRLTLNVKRVWTEQLMGISWRDILAEGVGDQWDRRKIGQFQPASPEMQGELYASFATLWGSVYGTDPGKGWHPDTMVWACEFERVTP
jgi:hypothetical protein